MNKYQTSHKAAAGQSMSVGCAVVIVGHKRVYTGELFNPLTWFRFEILPVIRPYEVDHVSSIK